MDLNIWMLPAAPEIHVSPATSQESDFAHLAWSDPFALMPDSIDLGDPASLATLRQIDAVWPTLWDETRRNCLRNLRVTIPAPRLPDANVALLPGGIVVVLEADVVFCCDPMEATTLGATETKRLHAALVPEPHTPTLLHTAEGVILRSRIPDILSRQAVTLVADASHLPGRAAYSGRTLIQWCAGGATVWPLVPAPACIALAAGVAGVPVAPDAAPVAARFWNAPNADARFQMLAPGLGEHVIDLLSTEVCDDLRLAITELCVDSDSSPTSQLAEAMALLPSCFHADPSVRPGEPPDAWAAGTLLMRHAGPPCVMLGIEAIGDVQLAVHALRDVIDDPDAAMFAVSPAGQCSALVTLVNDAALHDVLPAGTVGRIGVLMAPPHGPLELYTMMSRVSQQVGAPVIASAPCWGYCHRVAPNGVEAGNAAWFGTGVGLDELDALVSDIAHWG